MPKDFVHLLCVTGRARDDDELLEVEERHARILRAWVDADLPVQLPSDEHLAPLGHRRCHLVERPRGVRTILIPNDALR